MAHAQRIEVSMIFAEMEYQKNYWDFHAELLAFVNTNFQRLRLGYKEILGFRFWMVGRK